MVVSGVKITCFPPNPRVCMQASVLSSQPTGQLVSFLALVSESCFLNWNMKNLPVDVDSKTVHLRLFLFSLPNKVEFMGIVLGKMFLWLLGTLGALFFNSSCDWNSFDNPTSLCHPLPLVTHLPASTGTCKLPTPGSVGMGSPCSPTHQSMLLGVLGGILSNLEKENLRDVDMLSFGLLLQKHKICYSGSCWIVCHL